MQNFYVSASGSSLADGRSLSNAWPLDYALSGADGRILPGSIVWLRGGTYLGAYEATLSGSKTAKIQFRAFNEEKVILDRNSNSPSQELLSIIGNDLLFRDILFTNSSPVRRYSALTDGRPGGVTDKGNSNSFIGCHFSNSGWGLKVVWDNADEESNPYIYGCIATGCGYLLDVSENGYGGGFIVSLKKGNLIFRDNCARNNYGENVNLGSPYLNNAVVEGNSLEVKKSQGNITLRYRTDFVSTLVFDQPHGIEVGEVILVSGMQDHSGTDPQGHLFNGQYTVIDNTSISLSYENSGPDVASTAIAEGTAVVIGLMRGSRLNIDPTEKIGSLVVRENVVLRELRDASDLVRIAPPSL